MFAMTTVSAMFIMAIVIPVSIVNNCRGRDHFNRLFHYNGCSYNNWFFIITTIITIILILVVSTMLAMIIVSAMPIVAVSVVCGASRHCSH
jgi:ABC-type multidrug transport system fused ATPase/permease subunit